MKETSLGIEERKRYNGWRLRILITIIFGYGTYYLCRQNFNMIMPAFMEEFGYTKTQLGWILTLSSVVYGVGKFINGYISDQSNARYFMPIGLFISSLITFCLGFSYSLWFLGIFLIFNNWFQSMGWPPAARMLTHWFAPKELGRKWALGAASHQIGGAITLIFSGYLVTHFGWRYAFFIPAIIAAIVSYILFNMLRDSPKDLGFPPVEAYKGDEGFTEFENSHFTTIEIFRKVFINKNIWYLCLANMCVYIVRIGIISWIPLFLKEFKDISLSQAGWQVASYEVIGLAGGFTAGWLSDKIFHGKRGFVGALFMLCLAGALIIFWKMPRWQYDFSAIALIFVGFFVYGPQVLIGVASADFASKKAVGTANGLVGTMGYVGAGLSGIPVGMLVDNIGWSAAFMFFTCSALIGAIFFFLTWINNSNTHS
ncbi:MFS transporter [Rickettsiaceae bacterium]|nr:MFS transporter [Rickettsiaceae bacterium]